jgi:hypothetical protein
MREGVVELHQDGFRKLNICACESCQLAPYQHPRSCGRRRKFMFQMKYLDGTPVDSAYASAIGNLIRGAARAQELIPVDELEEFAQVNRKADTSARVGDENFDPNEYAKQWCSAPIYMKLVEHLGNGDPAFGGTADDRVVMKNGRVKDSHTYNDEDEAVFKTLAEAHEVAKKIPNRRPGSILGVSPRW